jgi:predicted MFS family arabinose efflux permease
MRLHSAWVVFMPPCGPAMPPLSLKLPRPLKQAVLCSVANTLLSPVFAIAPLIGGLLVDNLSYLALFVVNLAVAVVALLVTIFWLPDPRRSNPFVKQTSTAE